MKPPFPAGVGLFDAALAAGDGATGGVSVRRKTFSFTVLTEADEPDKRQYYKNRKNGFWTHFR